MQNGTIEVNTRTLEYQLFHPHQIGRPTLVFLHEGLGSVAMWGEFPARVAAATGCRTLVYSRYGYGQSDVLEAPRTVNYLHEEALHSLTELLDKLEIKCPVLIGHSDGGSISIIHAGGSKRPVSGLVLLAPHVFVEEISVEGVVNVIAGFETMNLRKKIAKYHRDAAATFWGWANIWSSKEFRTWNIESYLAGIQCPVLAIQGVDDEHGTQAQIEAIRDQVSGDVDVLSLADCRHSPHRDQPNATLDAIVTFVSNLA